MTAPTSPWNIPLFGVGDTIGPLASVFNSQSNALNSALNTIQANAFGSYANLAALNAAPGTTNGQHATVTADATTANNGDYFWNATATQWVKAERSGLVPIIPSSIAGSGVTLGANGLITFAAATAISVNGAHTTRFDNYRVLLDITASGASAGGQIRLRAGGTDDSSSNYSYQQSWSTGAALTANNAGSVAQWGAFPVAGVEASAVWELFDPALAKATRIQAHASMWSNATTGIDSTMSGRHASLTAFDGFTYTPSAGNVTGTLRIYGYNNE